MNKYVLFTIITLLLYIAIALVLSKVANKNKEIKIKSRFGNKYFRSSDVSVKKQIEEKMSQRASIKKKYKVETTCLQAGYNINYGEYSVICLAMAISLPLIMMILLKNIILAIVFIFIGYSVPWQFFKTLSNKRVTKMESQIGSFIRIIIERYKINKNISKSLVETLPDFQGSEPLYSELKKSVVDIDLGIPIEEVLSSLARRTGSKYLKLFSNYYEVSSMLSSQESKIKILTTSFNQYEDNRIIKRDLRKEIMGPVRESYIMVFAIPVLMLYQSFVSDGYLDFMINEKIGQIGLTGIFVSILLCVWFINAKIGAPLD
ncbi:TPA: type II secretion system F family protein [Clostridioides difficile]|uniref:type II secretion system F family protein n=1 Tax=Clostridioides difficile TaxID=1496 RepID=UPI001A273ABC|nr:hypothetical protein [Clostridioides difficile]EGT3641087.1 hypothetical protein [Clostridioides difficile]MBH7166058.1 hypothetical protein [Clostridioides difficile]MBH7845772.1 hypothetical protein [Clostridioides difficile]MBY1661385.1 hypothetical protein [Clostridioides difficile]MDI2978200.1 hypothetical protein [Clostridioides difficile]